jgi:hypothetical protein
LRCRLDVRSRRAPTSAGGLAGAGVQDQPNFANTSVCPPTTSCMLLDGPNQKSHAIQGTSEHLEMPIFEGSATDTCDSDWSEKLFVQCYLIYIYIYIYILGFQPGRLRRPICIATRDADIHNTVIRFVLNIDDQDL